MSLAFQRNQRRHCSRCGAGLDDPASEQRGTGPVCAGKDTVLFSRMIPANYAGATAILLGLHTENLPEEVRERYEAMRNRLLNRASKAQLAHDDPSYLQIQGQDLRPIIKEIDWILSHHMEAQHRRFLVKVVHFLGYVELAAVLSQEASTTPAKVWFDANDGRVYLKGKSNKPGFMSMRRISGISYPRYRGSEQPYSAPAEQLEKFLEVVQTFWPMYEQNLADIRRDAQAWLASRPAPTIAAPIAAVPPSVPALPEATMQMIRSATGGVWYEVKFPWLVGQNGEMYTLIDTIKRTIPAQDRKYNPGPKSWLIKHTHRLAIEMLLARHFRVVVSGEV